MIRRAMWASALVLFLGMPFAAQAQESYLDSFIVQVKPEKRMEFEAIGKKIASANRQHKGDSWITLDTVYGEANTVTFLSPRSSYADIDAGSSAFMGAMVKAFGEAGMAKVFQDFSNCVSSEHATIRRRRPELSINWPADPAAQEKLVGNTRWIRILKVYVRPGQASRYEEQLRVIKAAVERRNLNTVTAVSQSAAGDRGTVFYLSQLRTSMAGFDGGPTLQELLGEDAYKNYQKVISEVLTTTETTINRVVPELSNPPEGTVAAAPDFWRPKPPAPKPAAKKQ